MFWYVVDAQNNITMVSQMGPWQPPEPPASPIDWQNKNIIEYSALWDEAKRCPRARDGSYRYQLVGGLIQPTASVLDIDVPPGMAINADGILYWL